MFPTPEEVSRVVQETGMDRLQAYRHLVQRKALQDAIRGGRSQRSLADSLMLDLPVTAEVELIAAEVIAKAAAH